MPNSRFRSAFMVLFRRRFGPWATGRGWRQDFGPEIGDPHGHVLGFQFSNPCDGAVQAKKEDGAFSLKSTDCLALLAFRMEGAVPQSWTSPTRNNRRWLPTASARRGPNNSAGSASWPAGSRKPGS